MFGPWSAYGTPGMWHQETETNQGAINRQLYKYIEVTHIIDYCTTEKLISYCYTYQHG